MSGNMRNGHLPVSFALQTGALCVTDSTKRSCDDDESEREDDGEFKDAVAIAAPPETATVLAENASRRKVMRLFE
jgi:hypothetical protein